MDPIDLHLLRGSLSAALEEDVGHGDVTSLLTIPASATASGQYAAKENLVVSGLPLVREIARICDPGLEFQAILQDGDAAAPGTVMAGIRGNARSVLLVERTSLNFLQRLSGIATATRALVARVAGTRARIIDTRKTAPGLRRLDKYAVRCGGGSNHRAGLDDGILIKNNHVAFHAGVGAAVTEARRHHTRGLKVEVEVRDLGEAQEALDAGADMILLDNFSVEETRRAVALVAGRVPIESSGSITLDNVRAYAEAGVDYISVGALTHSVRAVDIHLRVMPGGG